MNWRSTKTIEFLALALVVLTALPLAAGFFGHIHPAFDSSAHFRVHLAIVMGLAAAPLLATSLLKVGAVVMMAALLAFGSTSGTVPIPRLGMIYGSLYAKNPEQPSYRLVHLNLRYNNLEPERVLSMIGRLNPDVITLNEVSAPWADKLKLITATYRYNLFCPFPNGLWGVALMSRRPFAKGAEAFCDMRGALAVAAIDFNGRIADIAALHLGWPWPYKQYWEVEGLSPFLGRIGKDAILAGDLNATPWSQTPRRVAKAAGLTLMPSPEPTWMSRRLPGWLVFAGLPIDNVFSKGGVIVHSIQTIEPVGSDHLPVLVEFSLISQPSEQEPVQSLALDRF